jgi:hypothetical protein
MESVIKALKDTPVPTVLIWAGLLFLLLGFVTKLGGIIEVQPNQKRWTIPIGLLLLTFGLVLNFTPTTPKSSPTTPASPSSTQISTKPLETSGLFLATTTLLYPDGDQLKADFRVYCPTSTIRPTNYVLVDGKGTVKKQGAWWEPAFTPKYDSERQLIKEVCDNK